MQPPPQFRTLLRDLIGHPERHADLAARAAMAQSRLRLLAGLPPGTGSFHKTDERRAVPEEREVERLADVFGLVGDARREFILAAALQRSPERVRDMVARLCERIQELERRESGSRNATG